MPKWTDKPWERQQGESEKAYDAFATYRDMGAERSLQAVVEKLSKSRTLISRWSCQWNWVERVRAYDNELEKQAMAKAVKERKDMVKRHIDIALELQMTALKALGQMKLEDMSPRDIREFIKTATELERLNREEVKQADNDDVIYQMEYEDMDDIEGEIYGTDTED